MKLKELARYAEPSSPASIAGEKSPVNLSPPEVQSFIQFASHDLRTPLKCMNRVALALIEDYGNELSADAIARIQSIADASRQMTELLEDLLAYTRASEGPIANERVDLDELVQELLDELRPEIDERDVEIVLDELPWCRGDRVLLRQALLNLFTNAIKFTRPRDHAVIHLGCVHANGERVYYVRDNGVGFEPAMAEKLFQPFRRLNNAQHVEGSGLGMALVQRIVERHSGRVWAEGYPNAGATFYFVIGT